jgi:rfaE bifunctional protein nucleotidyltransferase chain/domain
MNAPLIHPNELGRVIAMHHQQGIDICLTTGCFDVLHSGHVMLLERAADLGILFVGINSDASISKLKGPSRPVNKLKDRAFLLGALRCVNAVFEIDSLTVDKAIRDVAPAYWVKGGDWTIDTLNKDEVQAAKDVSADIVIIPSLEGYSTTNTLKRC